MSDRKRSIRRDVFYWGLFSSLFIVVLFVVMLIKPDFDKGKLDARNSIKGENERINEYMEELFEETDAILKELSKNRDVINAFRGDLASREATLNIYDFVKLTDENIEHVFSGYEDGTMLINGYELPEDFDPKSRPWYKAAISQKDRTVRISYRDVNSGDWFFSTSRAILGEGGEIIGVVAIDLSNERLSEILKSSYKYETQTSYMINDKNLIMVHGKDRFLGEKLETVVEGLEKYEIKGEAGDFEYELNGEEKWAHYRRIDGTEFYSVTSINSKEVLCPLLNRSVIIASTIAICALIIGLFQNNMLKNRFLEPFMELSERIKDIAEEKEESKSFYSFENRELLDTANNIEMIARKSIEDREELLRFSEDKYRKLVENLSKDYFIYIVDNDEKITYVSPSVAGMLGYTDEEFMKVGKGFRERARAEESLPERDKNSEEPFSYELDMVHKNGESRCIEMTEVFLKDESGEIIGVEGVAKDISDMKERQKKIEFLSFYDSMTGLYNRRFFEEELKRLDSERNYPLALLYADINGLKLANDIFGHTVGDELIVKVAENIKRECRKDDIIARMGGDEFAIILPKTEEKEVEQIVRRIKEGLEREVVGQIIVSASFGWAAKKTSGIPIEDILKKADELMYKKKLYESPEMRKKAVDHIIEKSQERGIVKRVLGEKELRLLRALGKKMSLNDKEQKVLEESYRLRNIGEIALEPEVLKKIGKLTNDEWKSIKRHPELGYRILSAAKGYSEIADYVLNHHERWDGTGYPKGKAGKVIPEISRIIAVVEAYRAMTEGKLYNGGVKNPEELKEEFYRNSGTQFDPEILEMLSDEL